MSELYAQIHHLFKSYPNLIQSDPARLGGEHHLFLTDRLNRRNPDFQIQVWNQETALLVIDLLISQGEGGSDIALDPEDAHYHRFRRMTGALADLLGRNGDVPWSPSYPLMRNPTLEPPADGWNQICDPKARAVAQLTEECFELMLLLMARPLCGPSRRQSAEIQADERLH